jgi:integral membrane protein
LPSEIFRLSWDTVFATPLARLRFLGTIEAISFLVLLGIAMPLKYLAGRPQMVHIVGSAHGALFLLFVGAALYTAIIMRWPLKWLFGALLSSVIPFGPFIFDAYLRRELAGSK